MLRFPSCTGSVDVASAGEPAAPKTPGLLNSLDCKCCALLNRGLGPAQEARARAGACSRSSSWSSTWQAVQPSPAPVQRRNSRMLRTPSSAMASTTASSLIWRQRQTTRAGQSEHLVALVIPFMGGTRRLVVNEASPCGLVLRLSLNWILSPSLATSTTCFDFSFARPGELGYDMLRCGAPGVAFEARRPWS